MGTGVFSQGMKLTTHLHLVSWLTMCGGTPPLPHFVFMVWCLIKNGYDFIAWYFVKHSDYFTFTFGQENTILQYHEALSFQANTQEGKQSSVRN
jgi:hypothetical protein